MSAIETERVSMSAAYQRRYPVGAEPTPAGGVDFRVWAPDHRQVAVVLEAGGTLEQPPEISLYPDSAGYFRGKVAGAAVGALYRFRLDHDPQLYPDPASRFQPEGPFGPSQVIDPTVFPWTDAPRAGVTLEGQVLYEMHIGTFTREGTWRAAAEKLPYLLDVGVTVLEVMPVADFPGRFDWGYDGVNLFAPSRVYGSPDDMRTFVDRAHALGLAVILDVIGHCLGVSGSFVQKFAGDWLSRQYENEWGGAVNFDGPNSAEIRRFLSTNLRYWIEEFHLDGFRIDATQAYFDTSPRHVLAEMTEAAREAAGDRPVLLIGENEPQQARMMRSTESGGCGMDALWNDDFHHSATVRLTGLTEAYYADHLGQPEEFVALAKWGYLYQGQWYAWQKKPRGSPAFDCRPAQFVTYLQNHDQVANSVRGERVHRLTSPGRFRAMTALWLLSPQTPLFLQGQEFCASAPFLYFADTGPERAREVAAGRAAFLGQFDSYASPEIQALLPDPASEETFVRCKLDWDQRREHREACDLHRDLLRLRREDPAFRSQSAADLHGAVLSPDALLLRWFAPHDGDRLLIANFGADLTLSRLPQPLLAPPQGCRWELLWSSDDPRYGGTGNPTREFVDHWRIRGESTLVLAPRRCAE